jgi:peptidoglycan biosynthesis protein MviN/MurJ (putative lipid II flippase)
MWWEELLEVAPALLVGLLFQVFVLLPLRVLFARGQMNSPLLFLAIGSLIWIAAGATILFGTNTLPQGDLWVDASVIVPGCVIAVAFTLMNLGKRATVVSSPTEP